ncbi:MAG: SPOR domain-containing protein [Acidobacteria bacterium]|nr:SPOR domain-containing protein [Acidobacteriota bacterium]
MMDQHSDSGYELVLDNRKLIITFAVVVLICGCFFVVGFMEGKRQGYQAGSQVAAETAMKLIPDEPEPSESPAAGKEAAKAADEQTEDHTLEWYKNVNEREGKRETAKPSVASPPAKAAAAPIIKPSAPVTASKAASYSVQVGAFKQKEQAETRAAQLRAKGFEGRIEPPDSSDGLFLLKVGRFKSRAEAVAMQLRLKKSGISSFIKTN